MPSAPVFIAVYGAAFVVSGIVGISVNATANVRIILIILFVIFILLPSYKKFLLLICILYLIVFTFSLNPFRYIFLTLTWWKPCSALYRTNSTALRHNLFVSPSCAVLTAFCFEVLSFLITLPLSVK